MAWGRRNNGGLPPTRSRGKVEWVDQSGGKPAPFAQSIPRYEDPGDPTPDVATCLVIGALFSANVPLGPDTKNPGKFPRLKYLRSEPLVRSKGLLIYTGPERVDERHRDGRIITVLRHTFFAGDGRYIVTNFDYVTPVPAG